MRGSYEWGLAMATNALMEVAWDTTVLGPMVGWPAPLRVGAELALLSPNPSAVFWGPSFAAVPNEAFAELLGSGDTRAFGSPAEHLWPHAWGTSGPRLAKVAETRRPLIEHDCRISRGESTCRLGLFFTPLGNGDGSGVLAVAWPFATSDRSQSAAVVGNLSHDIRRPLNTIALCVEVMLRIPMSSNDQQQRLGQIRQLVDQTSLILDQALLALEAERG